MAHRRIALLVPNGSVAEVFNALTDPYYPLTTAAHANILAVISNNQLMIRVNTTRIFPLSTPKSTPPPLASPRLADLVFNGMAATGYSPTVYGTTHYFKSGVLLVPGLNSIQVRLQKMVVKPINQENTMNGIGSIAGNVAGLTGKFTAQQVTRSVVKPKAISAPTPAPHPVRPDPLENPDNPIVKRARQTPSRVIEWVNGIEIEYTNIPERTLFVCHSRSEAMAYINQIIVTNQRTGKHQKIIDHGFVIIPPVKQNDVYLVQVAPKSDRARRHAAEAELETLNARYKQAFDYLDRHPQDIETIEAYVQRFIANSRISSVANAGISTLNIVGSVATGFGVTAIPTIVAAIFAEVGEQQLRADCQSILDILQAMKHSRR